MSIHYGKNIKTRYYKYVYGDWEQPVLTADDSDKSFIVSASDVYNNESGYKAWLSFSSKANTESWLGNTTAPSETAPKYYTMQSSVKLKFKSILMTNRTAEAQYVGAISSFKIQASDNGEDWVDLTETLSNTNNTSASTWNIEINSEQGYLYHRFVIYGSNTGSRTALGHPKITAQKQTDISEESTKEDYDFTIFEDGKIGHFYRGDLYRIDYYKGFINNFITVGTPTINKSLASGFTTVNNYLLIPAIPANITNFETILKVKFSNNTTNQHIFNTSHTYGFLLSLSNAGKLFVHISGNGSSWNIASNIHGTTVLSKDTWYYVKCSFDGSQYKVQLSTDKEIWTDEITINSTLTLGSVGGGRIGSGWQQDTPGSYVTFDLKESYIKIDDEYFWQYLKRCIYDYNFTTVGLPSVLTQDKTCTVTGFSNANYITKALTFDINGDWEFITKAYLKDISTSPTQMLFGITKGTTFGINFYIASTAVRLAYNHTPNSGWSYVDIATTVPTDRWLYIKYVKTGTTFTFYFSEDGETFEEKGSYTFTSTLFEADGIAIGCGYSQTALPSATIVDLTQTTIKVNNEPIWSCFKTSTDYVFTENSDIEDYDYSKPYKGEIILAFKGKDLVHSIYPNGIVFEENTAGTYTISPAISGAYEISLVGPGSGGTCAGDQASYASKSRGAGGGSGAYVKGIWNLTRGVDYTIVVGAGGPAGPTNSNNGYSKAAGDSSFGNFIVCGGGGGATAVWKGSAIGGAAGTVKACENPIQLITRTAGNQGKAGGGYTYYAGAESVFPPHGAGGFGQATGNYAGKSSGGENGYCKVRMLTIEPEQQKINVNFIGNVKFDNGVVSGFSDSNYLTLQENFDVSNSSVWEKVFKFTTGSDVSTQQSVIGCNVATTGSIVQINGSKFKLYLSSGSSSWDIASSVGGTYTVLANTTYYIKLEFTGTAYNLYYSLDGVDYILDVTVDSTKIISSDLMRIGDTVASGQQFLGSIDLSECYIKSNGKYLWKGISNDNI